MKILVVNPTLPYPPTSGLTFLSYGLLQALAVHNEVTYLALVHSTEELQYRSHVEKFAAKTVLISLPNRQSNLHRWLYRIAYVFRSMISLTPLTAIYHTPKKLRDELQRLTKTGEYEIVEIHQSIAASLVKDVCAGLPVLYTYELQSASHREFGLRRHAGIGKISTRLRAWLVARHEKLWLPHFRCVFTTQESECKALRDEMESRVEVRIMPLPLGPTLPNSVGPPVQEKKVVFPGVMNYLPNIDSARYLVEEIWPLVIERVSDARLDIVGRDPIPEVRGWSGKNGVTVTGRVNEVTPYIQRAAVLAIPARFSLGVKIKLIQGLTLGKAIVTTSHGIEGVTLPTGAVRVGDTPRGFADELAGLLQDESRRRSLEATARLAGRLFTHERAAEQLRDTYQELTLSNL